MFRVTPVVAIAATLSLTGAPAAADTCSRDCQRAARAAARVQRAAERVQRAEQQFRHARAIQRAQHRSQIARWRAQARPYAGFLARLVACESASSGGYRLTTTGNGFYFAFQFTARTWAAVAGGRTLGGIPVGYRGEQVPTRAEQDARAVRVLWAQGAGAWPVCSH